MHGKTSFLTPRSCATASTISLLLLSQRELSFQIAAGDNLYLTGNTELKDIVVDYRVSGNPTFYHLMRLVYDGI